MRLFSSVRVSLFGLLAVLAFASPGYADGDDGDAHGDGDPNGTAGIDYEALERDLMGDGLVGRMHGVVADRQLNVFTWTDPNDFFRSAHFPVISHVPEVASVLPTLRRHDKVRIKGQYIQNGAPQRHIYITAIEVLDRFDDGIDVPPYEYDAEIPGELMDKSELVGRVHAVAGEGTVLVVEYKDAILPVFVQDATLTKTLYRGDKIRLHYFVRVVPDRPVHLSPIEDHPTPIEVLESIVSRHDHVETLEGSLVLFPQSPQISFNVFALQNFDADGTALVFTLVNFDDPRIFQLIRAKLQEAWDAHTATMVNGRNKLINPKIRVRAHGTVNVQSPTQANPQILLNGVDDVELTFE